MPPRLVRFREGCVSGDYHRDRRFIFVNLKYCKSKAGSRTERVRCGVGSEKY